MYNGQLGHRGVQQMYKARHTQFLMFNLNYIFHIVYFSIILLLLLPHTMTSIGGDYSIGSFSDCILESGTDSLKFPTDKDIEQRSDQCPTTKYRLSTSNLNDLVMDYLVMSGFKESSEFFAKESAAITNINLESICERKKIHSLLMSGDITDAIKNINLIDRNILQNNIDLLFRLHRQQFVEILRTQSVLTAIEYATDNFWPFMKMGSDFLSKVEETFSLVVFCNGTRPPSPYVEILDLSQRQYLADDVNDVLLIYFCKQKEPKLASIAGDIINGLGDYK